MTAICEVVASYLEHLATHGYAKSTITARRYHLAGLCEFVADRDVSEIEAVTPARLRAISATCSSTAAPSVRRSPSAPRPSA